MYQTSEKCVACGQPMNRVTAIGELDHHCPEEFERRAAATQRRMEHSRIVTPTFGQRLSYGFSLLQFE